MTSEGFKKEGCCSSELNYQAYQIRRIVFIVAPIIAGADKFLNFLTQYKQYLAAQFDVFGNASTTMLVVRIVEISAGIGVGAKSKIFSYIVTLRMLGIIVNLLLPGKFYDVALRDLGLLLAAAAFGWLSYGACET